MENIAEKADADLPAPTKTRPELFCLHDATWNVHTPHQSRQLDKDGAASIDQDDSISQTQWATRLLARIRHRGARRVSFVPVGPRGRGGS